jgi:short subunit dehydrogenase-like uncharacterized protein
MAGRIVMFGATGFTGRMAAHALVRRGERPLLVGRSRDKLNTLAIELGGLETAVADVSDPQSVRKLLSPNDVLLTTVGPFQRYGHAALEAALDARAHYIDSTGEPAFVRRVFTECGERANRQRTLLLTACGYDYIPGNLAGGLALARAGATASRVDIGYYLLGQGSGLAVSQGTMYSSRIAAFFPGMEFIDGQLVERYGGLRVREFEVHGRQRAAVSVGASEHYALPQTFTQLRDVNVYLGWFGRRSYAMSRGAQVLSLVRKVPVLGSAVATAATRVGPGSEGKGPDEATLDRSRSYVTAIAYDDFEHELARVTLEGRNPYGFTADMLAFAAQRASRDQIHMHGARGPIEAFGLEDLEHACRDAGLTEATAQERIAS